MVTMIATQGQQNVALWVNEYKVSYSFDGGYFTFFQRAPNNSFHQVSCKEKDVRSDKPRETHLPVCGNFPLNEMLVHRSLHLVFNRFSQTIHW